MIVRVLYENEAWLPPLRRALERQGLPFQEVFVDGGAFDLSEPPPEGIYVNRMSPSAHTRAHGDGVHYLREYLYHLEAHGRRVINGSKAFQLEVSKVYQDTALRAAGIDTPHTVAVAGRRDLHSAARKVTPPFITKHNMGGKGLGVRLFRNYEEFDAYVDGAEFEEPFDGITLIQQYVEPAGGFITRVEIVGDQLQYAIRSSTAGGFELCPADSCNVAVIGDAFCPVGESGGGKFGWRDDIRAEDPLVQKYIALMKKYQIDVAGIEFLEDSEGRRYTYDINANTNYNGDVESQHGFDGMGSIAKLVAGELKRLSS